jgi:hypothetical protein
MACSLIGNKNFPLNFVTKITEQMYDNVESPFVLDVKWGERIIQPVFAYNQTDGRLDEGGINNRSSSTEILYNNNIYILQYVQLNKPTHESFQLNPSTVEMTLTFTALIGDDTNEKIIIIVLPFTPDPSLQEDPLYIKKMLDINNQQSTGLYSCLPAENENRFAYYTSCIDNPQNPNVSLGNILVFVSIYGTRIKPDTIDQLRSLYRAGATEFPQFYKPTLLTGVPVGSIVSELNYTEKVAASRNAITSRGVFSLTDVRTDTIDAYKCTPFDPDNDVQNGTIQIDMATGKPLSETLADREELREQPAETSNNILSLSPGKIERFLANSLGIFLAICFILIVFYLIIKLFRGDARQSSETLLPGWVNSSPILILVAFICAFIGFLVGSTLSYGT